MESNLQEEATEIIQKVIASAEMLHKMLKEKQFIPIDFIQEHNKLVDKESEILKRVIVNSYINEIGISQYNKELQK